MTPHGLHFPCILNDYKGNLSFLEGGLKNRNSLKSFLSIFFDNMLAGNGAGGPVPSKLAWVQGHLRTTHSDREHWMGR